MSGQTFRENLMQDLDDLNVRIQAAREELADVMVGARDAAIRAIEGGISEVEVARALGVDRARTLRRWLGK